MELKTTDWKVEGINLTTSDSIYKKLIKAINENTLDQSYLQKITGHNNPILVNRKKHLIQFC